jgi:hypothetical protein
MSESSSNEYDTTIDNNSDSQSQDINDSDDNDVDEAKKHLKSASSTTSIPLEEESTNNTPILSERNHLLESKNTNLSQSTSTSSRCFCFNCCFALNCCAKNDSIEQGELHNLDDEDMDMTSDAAIVKKFFPKRCLFFFFFERFFFFGFLKSTTIQFRLLLFTIIGAVIGLIIGIIFAFNHPSQTVLLLFGFPGEILMRMLRALVVPLIVCSVICAVATLSGGDTGRLAAKTLALFGGATLLASIMGILIVGAIQPGRAGTNSIVYFVGHFVLFGVCDI